MNHKNNNLMSVWLRESTVFSILCPLLIVLLVPLSIQAFWRGFSQKDWMEGYLFIVASFTIIVLGILWGLDRLLVNFVRPVVLSAVELLLIGSLGLWVSYSNRKLIIDASACSAQSVIIAYTMDDTLAEKPDHIFPFVEKITISDRNYAILSDKYRANSSGLPQVFQHPTSWGYGWQTPGVAVDVQDSRFTDFDIYLPPDRNLYLSFDEKTRMTKARVAEVVKEFLTQVKK
jgi:hypothetical protein